jgi:hypothetical protein
MQSDERLMTLIQFPQFPSENHHFEKDFDVKNQEMCRKILVGCIDSGSLSSFVQDRKTIECEFGKDETVDRIQR